MPKNIYVLGTQNQNMDDLIISENHHNQDDFINMELKSGFIDTQEIGICCLITCIIEIIGNGLLLLGRFPIEIETHKY